MLTSIVDTRTNEFDERGHAVDATHILIDVSRNPVPRNEKYSGDPAHPFAPKSQAEIEAWDAARLEADANLELDWRVFRALVQGVYELKTNNWTPAQFKARLKQLWKQNAG
mgnify:CR=1 FL=1|jgi:hypothetical protein|tara:strand:- start:13367 stop:13699 length:333 start_codon:yes stop_codon:yes gene_type:complete